jgi:Anaerobic dehydrogenases, typically selenocysteine-containing
MEKIEKPKGMTRRSFIQSAGVIGAGSILGAGLLDRYVVKSFAALTAADAAAQDWRFSYCRMCMRGDCAIRYRMENGVVMEVKGNELSPTNKGTMCPRGLSLIQNLYNPYRVKGPLKRTNPKKGLNEDPRWVEISWDEALSTVAKKFKAIHEKDPRGLMVNLGFGGMDFFTSFIPYIPAAFGTPNLVASNGPLCTVHYATELVQGCFPVSVADYSLCNYHITIGRTTGGNIGAANGETRGVANALARGMKLVVVDPRASQEAAKGEWVPIRPGTDLPFVLGLIHTVLYEIKTIDEDFLVNRTNGPYLVRGNGGYYRSGAGKPQVIDAVTGAVKEFDDPSVKTPKLEGSIKGPEGELIETGFSRMKSTMKAYTPEWAEERSTVPATTIRRIAGEFVSHARIGATININGTVMPYRPVSIIGERGSMNHQDGTILDLATKILNELVGALDVPGGCLGCNRGPVLKPDADGTVTPAHEAIGVPFTYPPQTVDLSEYYPHRHSMPYLAYPVAMEPEKYGLPYKIEAALVVGGNTVIGSVEPEKMEKALASIPFVVSIPYHHDEVVHLSDIVLPDHAILERSAVNVYETTFGGFSEDTLGLRMVMVRDPVPPIYNTRQAQNIVIEIFSRMGLTPNMFGVMNGAGVMLGEVTMVQLPKDKQLIPTNMYTIEQIWDRALQTIAGDGHGMDWFRKNGIWVKYVPREECYNYFYYPKGKTRYQIYFEGLRASGERLRANFEKHQVKIPDVNFDKMFAFFSPVPEFRETPLHKGDPALDLIGFNFKIVQSNFRLGGQDQLPWLMEVGDKLDPYFNVICINPKTAQKKGLRDGQMVSVESRWGKIKGKLKTTELFHPDCVAIAGASGRMVSTLGKRPTERIHYNRLLGAPLDTIDPIAGGVEIAVRVKISAA